MNPKKGCSLLLCIGLVVMMSSHVLGGDKQFGIGLNAGVGRLEGDLADPKLGPMVSGHLRYLPIPLGFSRLTTDSHPNPAFSDLETTLVPFEIGAIFNFLPFKKVNPYIFAGGGGVFWKAESATFSNDFTLDSFLKTGGGLEFRLSRMFALNVGATFRLSLTDNFDALNQGDEDDQVLDAHAGFTFYFGGRGNDSDNDYIPDELDLMPDIAEDHDGYLDHDGIPEKNPNRLALSSVDGPVSGANGSTAPIVIHHIISTVESGKDVPVKAHVYSDKALKVVATLYRPTGTRKWNVVRLDEQEPNLYQGEIPGFAISTEGLQYCVVAVDETLSGVGYSGLPNKPISVDVSPSGTPWRIVGGTVGAAAIGTASYLILRKQD